MTQAQGLAAALATPSPTIAALEPLQLTESEAAELDAFRAKPSRAEGLTFTPVPTIAAPSPSKTIRSICRRVRFAEKRSSRATAAHSPAVRKASARRFVRPTRATRRSRPSLRPRMK